MPNSQQRSSPEFCIRYHRVGAEQGGVDCMLRVRTGPECPEDNLKEQEPKLWDSQREKEKERERELSHEKL